VSLVVCLEVVHHCYRPALEVDAMPRRNRGWTLRVGRALFQQVDILLTYQAVPYLGISALRNSFLNLQWLVQQSLVGALRRLVASDIS
jgi:hypothetical protein